MKSVKELDKLIEAASAGVMETIRILIDPDSLVETDKYITAETDFGTAPGEGVVAGMAAVGGADIGIFAVNPAVLKGGIGAAGAKKIAKCVDNAVRTGSPLVGFIDTMGARFAEGLAALEGYADIFSAFSAAYKEIPTVLVVKDGNFGMLSYLANLCDFCVAYDGAQMGTSSPMILAGDSREDGKKILKGKSLTAGGSVSALVKDDIEMAVFVKKALDFALNPLTESADDGNRVGKTLKTGASAASVIAEIADRGSFLEIKAGYAPEVITGLCRFNGIAAGVVATNEKTDGGRLTAAGAAKISAFLDRLDGMGLPLVNLVNCKGVANSLAQQGALLSNVADMLYAYHSLDDMPKVALITGGAVGMGYTALASKQVMDYTVAWEGAAIGMLENTAAAQLVYADEIKKAKNKEKTLEKLSKAYGEEEMSAAKAAAGGYIDNVIDPKFSRPYLVAALQAYIAKS
jgi:acetyl-CoA carboxylase carboxyltransferase component